MSNQQVGQVYQSIISDVIDASRVDFEEGGVDDAVLERLRQGWQKKLSQLNVANFPWDPKPEPPPIANPPTLPSNAGNYNHTPPTQQQQQQHQQQYQSTQGLSLPMSQGPSQTQQPRIKPEPEDSNLMQQPLINIPGATSAQQRAAQHLQNNYGQRAAASISAIQNTASGGNGQNTASQQQQGPPNPQLQYQPHLQNQQMNAQQQQMQMQYQQQQQARSQGLPLPGLPQAQGQGQPQAPQTQAAQQQAQQQYRAMIARDAAQRQAQLQQQQQPTIKQAQNDGAGDEVETILKQYDAAGNEIGMGRVEIDGMIRQKILSMGQTMEGGGLMVPLKEASSKAKRQRKVVRRNVDGPLGGGDAGDDDDEDIKEDEDAINSDLDDPDEGLNDDEDEDDNMGHIMLCMYDKVQRVKNKWKCVMKDGVLTVNGKEYVFHKASGEYEW